MTEATTNYSVVWIAVVHSALAWIVIAFLTSTAGFMLLRLKKGSFSGRLIILAVFGMVVYSFLDQVFDIVHELIECVLFLLGEFETLLGNLFFDCLLVFELLVLHFLCHFVSLV